MRRSDFTPSLGFMKRVLRQTYEAAVRRFLMQTDRPVGLNDRQVRVAEWFARLARGNRERRVKLADVHAGLPQIPARTLQADLAALRDADVLDVKGVGQGTTYRFAAERA